MAMKIFTIGERKRSKGRDYTDLKFLMDKNVKPDYNIMEKLCGYTTEKQIQNHLTHIINNQDRSYLIRDVQPFLFNPYDDSIEHFEQYVNNYRRQ